MTERERRVEVLVGSGFLMLGRYKDAHAAFAVAGVEVPRDKLLECGHKALENGAFDEARAAFAAAGAEMPGVGLMACARKALENGRFDIARQAFAAAGDTDGLTLYGHKALKNGSFDEALQVFAAAGVEAPREGLIRCGHKALEDGLFDTACDVFTAAGDTEGLIACGNKALENGWFDTARDAVSAWCRGDPEITAEGLLPHAQNSWTLRSVRNSRYEESTSTGASRGEAPTGPAPLPGREGVRPRGRRLSASGWRRP